MLFSNSNNNDCGCKGGSKGGSGSGYGIGNTSPLLLGPKTGYGRLDPYRPDAVDSGGLKFPPLFGGNKNRKLKSIKKKSVINKHKNTKNKMSKSMKPQPHNKRNCQNKNHNHNKSLHKTKKNKLKMKGGNLSFSDFLPSSASNLSDGKQLASSPVYSTGSVKLSSNESALANPPPTVTSNQCKN